MGKRQVRIFQQSLLNRLQEIKGREVQVVLTGNRVFRGVVNEFSDVSLCLKDGRRHLLNFRLDEIEEVLYDLETLR